ncbi:MAG: NAD(P)/FAD-dependent oxidoreductase [Promethearchaeota archaeon]
MYDVIISGAGPSGSQCAQVLAEAGYRVALIEKDTNWRKPCGGALNPSVIKQYPQLKKLNLPKLKGVILHSADFHSLKYQSGEMGHGTIVDRLQFDTFIRNIAIDKGVEIFDKNISFDFVIKNNRKVGIKTKSVSKTNEFFGKIIIIADGMSSKLALRSGLRSKWKINEIALAKCSIIKGKHQLDEEHVYIFFRPYKGYGWIFPLDKRRFNIGIFTFGEDNLNYNLHEAYNRFLNDPFIKRYIPNSNYKLIWTGAYPFPIGGVLQKSLYDNNLMIIGDAGGFVSPISGEGIDAAIKSGKIAAETSIMALEKQDFSKNQLKNYKNHPEIKGISRNYKLKYSMIEFFYKNNGENLNRMLALTEKDPEFKSQVVDMFISKSIVIPNKEFLSKIKNKS